MKNIILKFGVALLNIIYCVVKVLPTSDKVTFISRQSNDVSMDFRMLIDEINRSYPNINTIVLTKKLTATIPGLIGYSFYIVKQMYHLATSKVVVVDGYCIPVSVLTHKKEMKIIQIWHALGAIKKFGYQTVDKPSGHSSDIAKIMKMHRNYDYVIAASNTTAKHFSEAFNVTNEKIIMGTLPRVDYLLNNSSGSDKKITEHYKLDNGKENVLYVPTFRKGKPIPIDELIEKFDLNRFNLIIKLHPLDKLTKCKVDKDGIIFDNIFSTYDMVKFCDRIITDYSALGIEVTVLNKPLYFYIYDIDDYSDDPGMNIDIESEMDKYASRTVEELAEAITKEYDFEVLNTFKNKYISIQDGECTKALCGFIMSQAAVSDR